MAYPFSSIIIIYNPNSTGDSNKNAKDLQKKLRRALSKNTSVSLVATEYAAHAEDIARKAASKNNSVLIVSSSGDGGYNEVLNGLLVANNPEAAAIVLPSGNANDHHEATATQPIDERIINPSIKTVDALKLEATKDGKIFTRYAHSYMGVGLTAYIGKKLTQASLNPINEKWLVVKYLFLFKSVRLRLEPDLRWHRYTSIVFGNIDRMSKMLKLSPEAKYDDGKMEVYELKTNSTLRTILSLLFGSTLGFQANAQVERIAFTARNPVDVQFDGEVIQLDAKSVIRVSIERNAVRTLQ
jgi:diacylglycerol kinase (ATP)